MSLQPDLVVRSRDGRLVAVVEVRNQVGFDRESAIRTRRNLMVHGLVPTTPYYVVVSQERAYVWIEPSDELPEAPPDLEIPMDHVMARFAPWIDPSERLRKSQLETIVRFWLNGLVEVQHLMPVPSTADSLTSSFLDALQGGTVLSEATV